MSYEIVYNIFASGRYASKVEPNFLLYLLSVLKIIIMLTVTVNLGQTFLLAIVRENY